VAGWRCPWCGATRRAAVDSCPESCGWSATAHGAALAAVEVAGVRYAATGTNPSRARESLGMALRRAGLDPVQASTAATVDAPDAGPWSFRWRGGPYVDVSRPGAVDVDVVDMWDDFEFDWMQVKQVTEFLRLCRRWLVDWADRFERDGD
jgi:hypothetical protein